VTIIEQLAKLPTEQLSIILGVSLIALTDPKMRGMIDLSDEKMDKTAEALLFILDDGS